MMNWENIDIGEIVLFTPVIMMVLLAIGIACVVFGWGAMVKLAVVAAVVGYFWKECE